MGIIRKYQVWAAGESTELLAAAVGRLRAGLREIKNPMERSGRLNRIEIIERELSRRLPVTPVIPVSATIRG